MPETAETASIHQEPVSPFFFWGFVLEGEDAQRENAQSPGFLCLLSEGRGGEENGFFNAFFVPLPQRLQENTPTLNCSHTHKQTDRHIQTDTQRQSTGI